MDSRAENRKMVEEFKNAWKKSINESLSNPKTPKKTMNEAFEGFNGIVSIGAINSPFAKPQTTEKPVSEVSGASLRRMEGLYNVKANVWLKDAISLIKRDLMDDGFEESEINEFIMRKVNKLINS